MDFKQRAPLDLCEGLRHIVELMKPRAESQNIALRLEIPDGLPLIQADARSMEELFSNLVSNAINYSPDGGEIVVSAVSSGKFLEVCVSDTGVGIDPEEISKIFDKFYRIKDPRTRHVRGSGLGLAIVKAIVESHGGSRGSRQAGRARELLFACCCPYSGSFDQFRTDAGLDFMVLNYKFFNPTWLRRSKNGEKVCFDRR